MRHWPSADAIASTALWIRLTMTSCNWLPKLTPEVRREGQSGSDLVTVELRLQDAHRIMRGGRFHVDGGLLQNWPLANSARTLSSTSFRAMTSVNHSIDRRT